MKKKSLIISLLTYFIVQAKEVLIIPYAYYAGQNYCLLLKSPDKSLTVIQGSTKSGDVMIERAAKIFSLQTKVLWGKYEQKAGGQDYRRLPLQQDYYKSVAFFNDRFNESLEKGLLMKTERYSIIFVEVPYINGEQIQKAPQLSEAIDSWYAQHQLVWVKIHALFEQKGSTWIVKRRMPALLEPTVKERLNHFALYKKEALSDLFHPQSPFAQVIERSRSMSARNRKAQVQSGHHVTHAPVRLRRLRRTNR